MRTLATLLVLLSSVAAAQTPHGMTGAEVLYSLTHPSPTMLPSAVLPPLPIANVLTFGPVSDLGTALTAACNSVPATGGRVILPGNQGIYSLAVMVTACSGKPITLEGDGPGPSTINYTTAAAGITITQTDLSQTVSVRGLLFRSTAPALIPRALDISFPGVASSTLHTLSIQDVAVMSAPPPGIAAPWPAAFNGGIRVNGAWFGSIRDVTFQGPVPGTNRPLAGTSGIELLNCYSTDIPSLKVTYADAALLQSAYSEYVRLDAPQFVDVNYGINITNAVRADKGNRAGLSYYVSGGEMDVIVAGANLVSVNDAYLYGTHYALSRAAGGAGLVASNTNGVQFFGNTVVQGGGNVTATAVLLNGNSSGNKIIGNTLNAAAGVNFTAGTTLNVAAENSSDTGFAPGYGDVGAGNSVTWRLQGNRMASLSGHTFVGSGGQSLATIPEVSGAANIVALRASPAGVGPVVVAGGTDANINLGLQGQGTGSIAMLSPLILSPAALPACGVAGTPSGTICKSSNTTIGLAP